jgi:hypothetical protein
MHAAAASQSAFAKEYALALSLHDGAAEVDDMAPSLPGPLSWVVVMHTSLLRS